MSDLIDTTEMYLKTVYELGEEGVTPMRARIAERLGHSGPTVSQTVARMERDGLLVLDDQRQLSLTGAGLQRAVEVMRKHRLAERLLTDVVGLDWEYVHEEACRWEHVMSERVERRLVNVLDHPHHDPYGNPIPGLDQLGEESERRAGDDVVSLRTAVERAGDDGGDVSLRLCRIGEPLQVDVELLARFLEAGLRPKVTLTARREDDGITVRVEGADVVLDLPDEVARHLFVYA